MATPSPEHAVFWVASYAHGCRRLQVTSPKGSREQCILPHGPWVQKLQRLEPDCPTLTADTQAGNDGMFIIGLAVVARGACWSVLSELSPDASAQWKYFHKAQDAFTVLPQQFWRLREPTQAFLRRRSRQVPPSAPLLCHALCTLWTRWICRLTSGEHGAPSVVLVFCCVPPINPNPETHPRGQSTELGFGSHPSRIHPPEPSSEF